MKKLSSSLWLLVLLAGIALIALDADECCSALQVSGETEGDPDNERPYRGANLRVVSNTHSNHLLKFGRDPNHLVRRGLLANRREKWVRILAEATELSEDTAIEFILISEKSGHDYEALFVSFARPSDIHKAIEFIGVPSGQNAAGNPFRFWPKGERLYAFVRRSTSAEAPRFEDAKPIRLEQLILDTRNNRSLVESGWVFTGSKWELLDGKKVYFADEWDPGSILSIYNEASTVLDVPRPTVKGEVYGYQVPNPKFDMTEGEMIEITLEPEFKDGHRRVMDLTLNVKPNPETGGKAGDLQYVLSDGSQQLNSNQSLTGFLAALERIFQAGRDPFIRIQPSSELTIDDIKSCYAFLDSIQNEKGIRIEPPPDGHLFYKSFLPNENFRAVEKRPSQPWELHLEPEGKDIKSWLRRFKTTWPDDGGAPVYEERKVDLSSPDRLEETLAAGDHPLEVLLIFAASDLRYGDLLRIVQPVMDTHSTMYVFLVAPDKP